MELIKVSFEKKAILRNLMELYQYDMSQFDADSDNDVNDYGLFDYKYLDHYWTEEGRHPFLVIFSGKLAGFVLIREITIAGDSVSKFSIAEFFIMKKYRRQGIGKVVANKVFEMFKGNWSIAWLEKNVPAKSFWTRIISEYSEGNCVETTYAGNPALEFTS
ncbi:GNAT family N-acetyltransferase [Paenibacillus sp. LHD-117]|uniref:GNAT family N-acetyltransferase n=1 Tax=Paenibacillus sp. LHD-117 TaxID=3071412 RepID=UPI0027DEF974|nr:GNAT family N-acetyltransferase [Paenibacillus sp. LHD-117]MDQ6420454.1 GNAT family N-acetyltransferase [Paenibacillus sp. LHD-117]